MEDDWNFLTQMSIDIGKTWDLEGRDKYWSLLSCQAKAV